MLTFSPDIVLGGKEGALLVDSLAGWIGPEDLSFAVLVETNGGRGTDADYREKTRDFFKLHRKRVYVAVTGMGPGSRIVAEMFRVGTGINLKGFADQASARAWLRQQGIAA